MHPVGKIMRRKGATVVAAVLCLSLGVPLAGCSTGSGDLAEAGPMATPPVVTVVEGVPAERGPSGPQRSGVYPGFSQPLTSAALQMTDEEAQNIETQLTALAAARRGGTISEAEYRRREADLRRLAAEHGRDTLAEITR